MNRKTTNDAVDWEQQINAMLDGELKAGEHEALQAEAALSRELREELLQAQALQEALHQLPGQLAPPGLREKLRDIGREDQEQQSKSLSWWRWAAVAAVIPLVLVFGNPDQPPVPSAADIEQGRSDLAVALKYLDKAGRQAAREIDTSINGAVIGSIQESTVQVLNRQLQSQEEVLL